MATSQLLTDVLSNNVHWTATAAGGSSPAIEPWRVVARSGTTPNRAGYVSPGAARRRAEPVGDRVTPQRIEDLADDRVAVVVERPDGHACPRDWLKQRRFPNGSVTSMTFAFQGAISTPGRMFGFGRVASSRWSASTSSVSMKTFAPGEQSP